MNCEKGGGRGLRRAGALAVVAAIAVLTAGCGIVHVHIGSAPGAAPGSLTARANDACKRLLTGG